MTDDLPQRLPNLAPARIATLRRGFAILQKASPRLAARLAFHLFLRPSRLPVRAENAAMLARARQHLIAAGTDRIAVQEWGSGPRIALIVHGWSSRAARFTDLAAALLARGWHVFTFDAPGHGLSPGRDSSLPRFIAALDAVATRFGPPQALVGHSLGALAIASRHATAAPGWSSRLRATALVSTPSGARFLLRGFTTLLGITGTAERLLLARFKRKFQAVPEDYAALPGLTRIPGQLLLVHDQDDDLIPHAHSLQLQAAMPAARLLSTRGLGHSTLTRDAATITAIVDFLDTGAARPQAQVRRADLADARDAAAVVQLLDAYARDPLGGGEPLTGNAREQLIPGLMAHPMARVWLAFEGTAAVGVCVGFVGFSTFNARPLLNIHDLAVLPEHRGRGTGRALLAAAEALARAEGCCKLTLEVLADNVTARHLYEHLGFHEVYYGKSGPALFQAKTL
ncbi:MAG: GNAT family N-acetyltransferase [Steroidobacteraceae bacterium]